MRVDGAQENRLRTVRMNHKDARCEISHTALFRPGKDKPHSSLWVQVQVEILLGVLAGSRVTRTLAGHSAL